MLEGQVVWHPWNFREILEGHDQLGTLGITIKLLRCGTLGTSREVLEGHNQTWHPWNFRGNS